MSHHLLPGHGRRLGVRPAQRVLIRDPAGVVASHVKSRATVAPEDIGLPQQARLFELARTHWRNAPRGRCRRFARARSHLRAICAALGIAFTPRMLAGGRPVPRERRRGRRTGTTRCGNRPASSRRARDRVVRRNRARVAEACRPAYEAPRARADPGLSRSGKQNRPERRFGPAAKSFQHHAGASWSGRGGRYRVRTCDPTMSR